MRYDTVIIGGGLSSLVCGIELARGGKSVALVATGHSALHFSSGSFGLYNAAEPLKAITSLEESHPYSKLEADSLESLAARATEILNVAGIATNGDVAANHYIMTPTGSLRQCWLSLEGTLTSADGKGFDFASAAIFAPEGFLDFYTEFVADTLRRAGVRTSMHSFSLPEIAVRRNNPTELRSVSVARALDKEENLLALSAIISREAKDAEVVVLPAVLGFERTDVHARLEKMVDKRIVVVPTLPPSVEGIKMERALRRTFERMGGVIFAGHTVDSYTIEDGLVVSVATSKDVKLEADEFVLASGSFIGGGLVSTKDSIVEPLFGAELYVAEGEFTSRNLYDAQPFMSAGVVVDSMFRLSVSGAVVENLYACGAVLSGFNPVKEGCGAGVAMLTALKVADNIINR